MQMFDKNSEIQAVSKWTMDYPEMKLKYPLGSTVAWIGRSDLHGSWGKIAQVTSYSPITPALKVSGRELFHDPLNFEVLIEPPRCTHGTHIQGGDCRSCAQEKRQAIIDSGDPYYMVADPVYARLVASNSKNGQLTETWRILKDVEGAGVRPFADKEASVAYAAAISGLDCFVTHAYYAHYMEMESKSPVLLEAVLKTITESLNVAPIQKDTKEHSYQSQSWIWPLDKDRSVQLVFWRENEGVGIRLYNKAIQPFY